MAGRRTKSQRLDTAGKKRGRARQAAPARDAGPPVVGFVSLGCSKNLVDSEKMLGQIAESGAVITADEAAADTIVVNTCGFLAISRDEGLAVIRELAARKQRGELRRIVVAGCLVQRDGTKLIDEIPEIDALVGVNNRDDVPAAVWGTRPRNNARPSPERHPKGQGAAPGAKSSERGATLLHLGDYHPQPWDDRGRLRLTPRHYAYLRISEGCNQKCTFCTIPSIRGPMHSKSPDELAAEGRELIADGARELILIGQDTTSYGGDIGYEAGLAGLLRHLNAAWDGAAWIRLMYVYPSILTDEMLDAIAACERVVKYIDIPLQHINDRVLKAMHRRVTRAQTEQLLERIRRRIPGVSIRTTFIVGFPGETEEEFRELLDFAQGFGFDAAGAFRYSLERETPAGRMKGQLDEAVKNERYERFMLVQQAVAFAAAEARIGKRFDVLIDGADEADQRGILARHAGQAPEVDACCVIPDEALPPDESPAPGALVRVKCIDTDDYDLVVSPARTIRGPRSSASRRGGQRREPAAGGGRKGR
jgi:ribosomal protein S12 methylthiotransferase